MCGHQGQRRQTEDRSCLLGIRKRWRKSHPRERHHIGGQRHGPGDEEALPESTPRQSLLCEVGVGLSLDPFPPPVGTVADPIQEAEDQEQPHRARNGEPADGISLLDRLEAPASEDQAGPAEQDRRAPTCAYECVVVIGCSGPVRCPGARSLGEPDRLGEQANLARPGDVQHDASAHVADEAVRCLQLPATAQCEVTVFLDLDGAAYATFEFRSDGYLRVAFRALIATAGGQRKSSREGEGDAAKNGHDFVIGEIRQGTSTYLSRLPARSKPVIQTRLSQKGVKIPEGAG